MSNLKYAILIVTLLVGASIVSCGDYISCRVSYALAYPDRPADEAAYACNAIYFIR